MREPLTEKIAWQRRGVGRTYVGALTAGPEGVRLTGRDPVTGIDVALSIPLREIEHVGTTDNGDVPREGDQSVVLELAESEPIVFRIFGKGALHAQLLARRLGALTHVPAVLAQGGSR